MIELKRSALADIPILMSWVDTPEICKRWGGPGFRYPYTQESFLEDLLFGERPSFTLWEDGVPVGFGQCYVREKRCHLGRLITAPDARGRGLGTILIGALVEPAAKTHETDECSLFVYPENSRAAMLYRRMGFQKAAYPGPLSGFDDCDYMVAPVKEVLAFCASQ